MDIVRYIEINIDKEISIDQRPLNDKGRPDVTHKIRKLLFFLIHEGLSKTYNKIRSKRGIFQPQRCETLLTVQKDGVLYANFSTQSTQDPASFVLKNEFFRTEKPYNLQEVDENQNFNQFLDSNTTEGISLSMKQVTGQKTIHEKEGVFIYGLGDYSRVYIAPNIKSEKKLFCVDYNQPLTSHYKETFGYKNSGLLPKESYTALQNTERPLAIIATYHSDHTQIAKEIFEMNPNTFIFIEKPPCVTKDDIKNLLALYEKGAQIEIGYNRRYIPLNKKIRDTFFKEQKVITISVKEILINDSHWYFWPNQGTRITGNLTHWIDLAIFWIDGAPVEINVLPSPSKDETIAVSILFSEGSLVNITVSDKGNSLRGVQERIEVRTKNQTVSITDYMSYKWVNENGKIIQRSKLIRDKGHDAMYQHLIKAYRRKEEINYTKKDFLISATLTHHISEMYSKGVRNSKL